MKSVFSHLTVILLFLMVSVSPVSAQYDLFGYGSNATGGGNATPILVDTEAELIDALSGNKSNRVVIITANITVTTQFTSKGSNITLLALPGRCLISNGQSSEQSGILNMRGSNIIIRNVTFIGPGAYDCDGKDLLQFEDATNAWVDHCDFQDGCDGNFDIKSNSDNITVTWCRFRYLKPAKAGGSGGSNDHRYTNLLGSSSSAKPADGTYNVSYAYNWWDNGCKERMVRCRNCEIHFFNCYWNSNVANYYVGPENAKCYFEGCTFAGNANEADKIFKSYGGTNACRFVNSVGNLPSNQGTVNTPSYPYFVESASDAVASITDVNCGAGATLVVEADGSITTCGANLTKYTVTFNLNDKGTNFTQEVYENHTIAAPATPTTSGFVFDGWYTDQACKTAFNFSTQIKANTTLYAKWVQAMTVTFNLNGKGTNFTQEVVSGGKASVPSNPTAAGYIFAGWYTDEQCTTAFDFNTTITAAKTIYAKWEETNYCYEFTPATSGDALIVGSVIAGNANSGGTMKVSSLKAEGSISYDKKGLKFSSGSADIVTVTLDNYLQAGSIISLTLVPGGSSDERGLDILDANGKDVSELVWEVSPSDEARTLSYEVTGDDNLVGTKVFQLQRHNSIYLKNITVGNCGGTSLPTYTITYKANGGTGDDIVAAETMTVANCTFTAPTGYEFGGWNTEEDGSGTDYAVGRAINADVTLYAQWTIHSYTVHFDMQGHGSNISNQIVNYGAKVKEPTKPAVLDYTFGGWYKEAACTNAWNFETDVVTSEITLYAKWEELSNCADETVYEFSTQDEFTTAWDVVKASYDCAVQTSAYNDEISPINGGMLGVGLSSPGSVTITTKAYYTNITNIVLKLASTDSSNPNVTVSVVNGSTVTDLFSVTPKTANIIPATSNKQWGTHAQELAGLSGKIRITFKSTSTNARYATIDDVKICGVITELPTYTVTYNLNGGSGTTPTQAATTAGSTFTLASADGITKDSYTFAGWNDGTTTYAAGATYTMPANNITLTAQWTENVVTPDPTPGGGGGCVVLTDYATSQYVTTTPRRMYAYEGSPSDETKYILETNNSNNKGQNDGANVRLDRQSYLKVLAKNATTTLSDSLFTNVSSISFKWKFHSSGTNYTTTVDVYVGSTKVASGITLTGNSKEDYKVQTISVLSLTGTVMLVNTSAVNESKYSLYLDDIEICTASASAASQTAITLSPQGGTDGTTEVTATKDEAMPEITIPTRAGYNFQGYFTANGGSGTKYYNADGTSAKNWDKEDATFTLVAYWTAKTYTVTLDANGGNGGTESVTATYNAVMPSITPATLAGYALTGYFDAASGGTKYYNADGTSAKNWDKTSATTLYAQWECTAPTNVAISGEYVHFPGETLTLTVSGDNIAANATYTWKKGDQVIAGQTTATLTIDEATIENAGNYTCTISNGASCEATANFTIKMYSLRGLIDWSTDCSFTKVNATTATYSMELAGNSSYDFKVYDGSVYYGNTGGNPTMTSANCTNWTMQENMGNNVTLQTTASGTYTFTLDYSNASNPTISVTYPQKKMVYFNPGEWNCAKYAVYSWDGEGNSTVLMTKIDDCADRNIYYAEINAAHSNVIFIGGTASYNIANTWSNVSYQTIDLTYPSDDNILYEVSTTHLFLQPNSNWKQANARFAAYFYGNGETWVSMTKVTDNLYKVEIPTAKTYPSVIFCRMNPSAAANNWDNKWNQSDDLTITKGNNHYTITENNENWSAGSWKTAGSWTSFTPNYSVTFDANGHGTAPAAQCVAKNGKATTPTEPTETGYTFGGWYTDQACTTAFNFSTAINNDITLYAKWTVNTYQITYKEEDRTTTIEGLEPTTYTYGVGVAELPTPSEKIGYTFDSWYSEYCIFEDEEGANNPGHGWVDDCKRTSIATTDYGNVTFLAKYIPNTYTVTFNANEGTINAGEINSYTFGVGATLPTDVTKENYTFLGWFDNEGLTGTAVTTISTTTTGNKTYWAKWENNVVTPDPILYTVTFNANGGQEVSPITQTSEGAAINLPTPTRDGYEFNGWYINGTIYDAGDTYTPTANITAYAIWQAECTASGSGSGGEEETITLAADGTNKLKTWEDGNFSVTCNTKNAAQKTYVKPSANDTFEFSTTGTEAIVSVDIYYSTDKNLSNPATTTIIAPSTSSNSDYFTAATENNKIIVTVQKQCYVFKTVVTYTTTSSGGGSGECYYVTYNGNGAESGFVSDSTAYHSGNTTVTVKENGFTKTGYTFNGWNTAANGSGTSYAADATFTIEADVELFAQWTENAVTPDPGTQYTVTFNANGHGTAPAAQTVAGGGTITEPTNPTAQDHVFLGWYTDQACTTAFNFSTAINSDITLYAKWNEMDILLEDRCWNISEFETCTITAPQTIDQLHIVATPNEEIIIDKGTKTIDDISFTNRLKYGGKGSLTTRNLWFSVKGNCQVDIYMMSANSTQTRHLGVATGSFTNVVATFDASPTPAKVTYEYTGGPTTIFLYPTDNGVNIYQICVTYLLPPCTTPELSSLTNQTICEGGDAEAWTAAITNELAAGEIVSYQWTKRGNATILSENATYQLKDVTEAMGGTYVLTAIVSADGKSSATASTEVTLTVIPATEAPTITTDKQKVYTGNSVTLTATTGTPTGVTYQWYTCDDAEGTNATEIPGATNNAYTLASAGDAGTYYYYKVIVTGDGTHSCGTAEAIFPLVVSTPSAGCYDMIIFDSSDNDYDDIPATGTSGVEENSDATWTSVGTSESNSSCNYTYGGKTYKKGWKFVNGSTSSDNRYIQFVIPEGYTGSLFLAAYSTSTNRTVFIDTKPTNTVNNTYASIHISATGTLGTASAVLNPGTYYVCATDGLHLVELSIEICSDVNCTDPEVTATVDNAVICAGNEAVVKFTANNAADGATFQWQKHNGTSWENISGATNATYTINPVAAENTGKYRVIAEAVCKRISNELTLRVLGTPVFNTFNTAQSVMTRSPLSISDVQATNATGYTWYKSADATFNSAEDTQIGNTQDLMISSVAETAGSTFYLFCLATNSCGTTESQAITVTVTELVEEECATPGNEAQAELFSFTNSSCSKETYNSTPVWDANGGAEYLTYKTQDGKLFETAKVTIARTNATNAVYGYSIDGGTNWTYALINDLTTTLTPITITFPEGVNAFCIGRNISGSSKGSSSGHFYLSQACFTYANTCTETTLTPSEPTKEYNLSVQMDFVEPTFTLKSGETTLTANLTYSSSDVAIVTVDENGNLTFTGMTGTVTITATYAGGTIDEVDYCACQGSYTITVGCKDAAPKIFAAAGTNLDGCNASITLEAKMQDGTYFAEGSFQWYRDGVAIEGATGTSYEVVRAGTYTVWRTNTCTLVSTNSAVVTNENLEPKVERLTPFQYYHADKNYSAQMKDRHLFAVTSYGTYEGKRYHLTATRNGETVDVSTSTAFSVITSQDNVVDTVMIDLNRLKDKYSEGDEIVITCTAVNSCNELSVINNSITIHVIDKTPVLALICSGAEGEGTRETANLVVGGDFLTGYNKADLCQQTGAKTFDPNTEWGFYTELKKNYIVVPVNGYAQFNKLNYEPFDILLLTDYPKSSHSEAAQKIIDDMAELCDYRPLLSFKTHFQSANWAVNGEYKYNKWTKKGFVTAPVVPVQTALYADIVCYAHPMFEAISDVTASEDFYHNADDHDQLVYKILSQAGHEGSKGMQGFELADAANFVTIGLIHNDASAAEVTHDNHEHVKWTSGANDRQLVAIAERQANIEARMILFSINCGAQSMQTEGGRQVILQCLKYLYDPEVTDPELIVPADCHLTFDNKTGDYKWSTAGNWAPGYKVCPTANSDVRIAAPCTVDIADAEALSVQIVEGGSLTIGQGAALNVTGPIIRFDKETNTSSPTESEDIFIGSVAAGNGTLIFNNNAGTTKATVQMYSTAKADTDTYSAAASTWQYIGTPHSDVQNAANNYYNSWLYQYDTGTQGWVVIPNGGPLVPFRGYCVTHPESPHTYTMTGTLTATTSHSAEIPAGKYVVIANSWTAPIQVANFEDDDLENLTDKTVYLFNTGSDPEGDGTITPDASATQETRYAAGTYISIPIHSASYTGDATISSMQGFYVVGGETDGAVHLDYDKLVRPKEGQSIVGPPMHAPKRIAAQEQSPIVLKMIARGSRYDDNLFVLEREDFTRGYDSGWDGEEWGGSDVAPILYTTNENFIDQTVCAIPDMEGTLITFRAGEDNEYTFHFDYNEMAEALYLLDIDTQIYTRVLKGNTYTFTCADKAAHSRFILTRKAPQIATGTDHINTGENAKAVKFIKDDKIFIFVNGTLYDATGKMVIR